MPTSPLRFTDGSTADHYGFPNYVTPEGNDGHSQSRFRPRGPQAFDNGMGTMNDTGVSFGEYGQGRRQRPPEDRTWLPGADFRLRKLEMPLFDGEDAYGWVYRVEG